jgi:hypothetical protein
VRFSKYAIKYATAYAIRYAVVAGSISGVSWNAGTPQEESSTFREILIECTSFEHGGGMTKQNTDDLVAEVTQAVVDDDDIPISLPHHPQAEGATPTAAERIVSGQEPVLPYPAGPEMLPYLLRERGAPL